MRVSSRHDAGRRFAPTHIGGGLGAPIDLGGQRSSLWWLVLVPAILGLVVGCTKAQPAAAPQPSVTGAATSPVDASSPTVSADSTPTIDPQTAAFVAAASEACTTYSKAKVHGGTTAYYQDEGAVITALVSDLKATDPPQEFSGDVNQVLNSFKQALKDNNAALRASAKLEGTAIFTSSQALQAAARAQRQTTGDASHSLNAAVKDLTHLAVRAGFSCT